MRILVTGSRDWLDSTGIAVELLWHTTELSTPKPQVTLVSGNCPTGADAMAEKFARLSGWEVELHPANWNLHGKSAGFIRNKEMVDLGADLCLAFIRNNSKGATHTANLAEKAGIPTFRILDTFE